MSRPFFILSITLTLFLSLAADLSLAQSRMQSLENKLNTAQADIPALNEKISASVSDVPIQEFVRTIALNSTINLSIDPGVKYRVTGNYNGVRVADLLLFLCKEYSLSLSFTGTIISLVPYSSELEAKPVPLKKELKIDYDLPNDLMSIDVRNDSLTSVMRKITDLAKKNIIIPQELAGSLVSGYIKDVPFETALDKFLLTNKLVMTKTPDDFYVIERYVQQKVQEGYSKDASLQAFSGPKSFNFVFQPNKSFSLRCTKMPLAELVRIVSDTLGYNHSIVDKVEGTVDLNISNCDYENFLNRIFLDGVYCYQKLNGFYLVGKSENPLLKSATLIQLQHRTVDKIMDIIPTDVVNKLVVKEFAEQNSLIVIGNPIIVKKFQNFIGQIDQVVPVVLIEVLIVEISKTKTVSTGISLGAGKTALTSNQNITGGFNTSLTATDVNSFFNKISGLGLVNLGRVSSDFYLNIKALEEDGRITIKSTPKLATLNGHEASLSSGETKYYKEERSNYIGTQNPTLSNSYVWQSVKADLAVTIKPFVSGNDQITLDITVDQSQFTPREFENSPPGSVTRKFKSLIRVKNQEMILLGGLDKVNSDTKSSGLPLIARIPVLKWIFGSNSKTKSDSKLSVFIQPTVIN